MAYTFQDLIDVTSTASGTTLTQSRTYAVHDRVVVWVRYGNLSGTSVASISDGTNTYTRIGTTFTDATTGSIYDAFECKDCAAGTFTLTYTLTVAEAFRTMAIVRYSGLDNTTTTLVARQLQNSTAPSSGNLTPGSQPGALIGLAYNDSTSNAITADTGAGFTSRGTLANEDSAFGSASRVEDRRLTSTSAVAATFAGTATDNIIVYGFFAPEAAASGSQMGRCLYVMP